jgi:hypothetical protein
MSEEISAAIYIAQLQAEIRELRGRAERAEATLDTERQLKIGHYAFYHRHLALVFVRHRDGALHHEASSQASRQIAQEGGKSYTDVVGELEQRAEQAEAEIRDAIMCLADAPTLSEAVALVHRSQRELIAAQRAREAELLKRAEQAEAEAAALRTSLQECKRLSDSVVEGTDIIDLDWIGQEAARALAERDAGAALLAELALARAVVETVKEVLNREASSSALTVALANYDEAVKGASE